MSGLEMAYAWRETNLCQRKCYSTQTRNICNHLHPTWECGIQNSVLFHSWKWSSSIHPELNYISSVLSFLYFFPKQLQLATIKDRIVWTNVASPLSFSFLKLDLFSCGLETNSSCSNLYFLEQKTDICLHWTGHCLETFHETLALVIYHQMPWGCLLCPVPDQSYVL